MAFLILTLKFGHIFSGLTFSAVILIEIILNPIFIFIWFI